MRMASDAQSWRRARLALLLVTLPCLRRRRRGQFSKKPRIDPRGASRIETATTKPCFTSCWRVSKGGEKVIRCETGPIEGVWSIHISGTCVAFCPLYLREEGFPQTRGLVAGRWKLNDANIEREGQGCMRPRGT